MIEEMQNYYRLNQNMQDVRELSEELEKAKAEHREGDIDTETLHDMADNIPVMLERYQGFLEFSKRDLANRIKRRKRMIILVLLWPLLAIFSGVITIIAAGGSWADGESWMLLLMFLYPAFMFGTYSLCWVGFPIGWKKIRKSSGDAENATVMLVAFFAGLFTMCFSCFIAIVKIFSEKKDISYVKYIIVELNRTITRIKTIEEFVSKHLNES